MKTLQKILSEDLPQDAVPYKSRNETGTLVLSPYSSDWNAPQGFKDVGTLVYKLEGQEDLAQVESVPVRSALATQYEIGGREGEDDPVFPDLHEIEPLPVAVKMSDGYYHFIDGHHRLEGAVRRGNSTVKAWVFHL